MIHSNTLKVQEAQKSNKRKELKILLNNFFNEKLIGEFQIFDFQVFFSLLSFFFLVRHDSCFCIEKLLITLGKIIKYIVERGGRKM